MVSMMDSDIISYADDNPVTARGLHFEDTVRLIFLVVSVEVIRAINVSRPCLSLREVLIKRTKFFIDSIIVLAVTSQS